MKFKCGSCEYWESIAGQIPDSNILLGNCKLKPPVVSFGPKMDALTQQLSLAAVQAYPRCDAEDWCAFHSSNIAAQLQAAIAWGIEYFTNRLDYNPDKHTINAGMSRVPSLDEAAKLAECFKGSDNGSQRIVESVETFVCYFCGGTVPVSTWSIDPICQQCTVLEKYPVVYTRDEKGKTFIHSDNLDTLAKARERLLQRYLNETEGQEKDRRL